jgi:hypothetical protein
MKGRGFEDVVLSIPGSLIVLQAFDEPFGLGSIEETSWEDVPYCLNSIINV